MPKKAPVKKAAPKSPPKQTAPKCASPAPKSESSLPPLKSIPPDNEQEEKLRELLNDLDNLGVAIDETEFRKLSDAAKRMAERWVSDRKTKSNGPALVPPCLDPWASKELLAEWSPYYLDQEETRKTGFPVSFGKPSVSKAVDEQTPGMITMKLIIPDDSLSGNMADALFKHKRLKIEFSRRGLNDWKQKVVDPEGDRRIVACEADVSGFKTTRHNRQFQFLVSETLVCIAEAFDTFWGSKGSARVEVLGEPAPVARDENGVHKPKAKPGKGKTPAAGPGQTLFDKERDQPIGETETVILANTGLFSVETGLFKTKAGWLTTCDITSSEGFSSITKETQDNMQPRPDQEQALEARLGRIVDFWAALPVPKAAGENKEHNLVLTGLKDWLNRLTKGEKIDAIQKTPMPWVDMSKAGGS